MCVYVAPLEAQALSAGDVRFTHRLPECPFRLSVAPMAATLLTPSLWVVNVTVASPRLIDTG